MKNRRSIVATLMLTFLLSASAAAQQINGTPGSAAATTTIDGKQLPPPDPKFSGAIKDGTLQSKPWWSVEDRSGSMLLPPGRAIEYFDPSQEHEAVVRLNA